MVFNKGKEREGKVCVYVRERERERGEREGGEERYDI